MARIYLKSNLNTKSKDVLPLAHPLSMHGKRNKLLATNTISKTIHSTIEDTVGQTFEET
jgi:hypothetical protein